MFGPIPQFVWADLKKADDEAKRLARLFPTNTFFVLKALKEYKAKITID